MIRYLLERRCSSSRGAAGNDVADWELDRFFQPAHD